MAVKKSTEAAEATEAPVNASAAHAAVGRLQPGEVAEVITTRVPRGVDELASDATAEHEGVAALQAGIAAAVAKTVEQGYRGRQVDSTPNENYTLKGVGAGLPTPETTVFTPRGV